MLEHMATSTQTSSTSTKCYLADTYCHLAVCLNVDTDVICVYSSGWRTVSPPSQVGIWQHGTYISSIQYVYWM